MFRKNQSLNWSYGVVVESLSEERYESLLNDLMEAGLEAWQNNARQTVLSEIFRDFNPLDTAVYTYWLNFAQRIGFLGSGQKQVLLVRADAAKLSEQEQIYFQQSIVENKRDGGGCDETLDAFVAKEMCILFIFSKEDFVSLRSEGRSSSMSGLRPINPFVWMSAEEQLSTSPKAE